MGWFDPCASKRDLELTEKRLTILIRQHKPKPKARVFVFVKQRREPIPERQP